jgi:hypothetical protein
MRPIVFLGPSLARTEAERLLDADFRPPVKRGDLPSLPDGVEVVGIIDGVFMGEAPVGHREILDLLRRGVAVIGGSSMGALRAAELSSLGMKGVGTIFDLYANGTIEGDDEVALVFDPETLQALSEPLVNIRVNLDEAKRRRLITPAAREHLLEAMRATYFPRRTIPALLALADELLSPEKTARLRSFVENDYIDVKKKDAIEVLTIVESAVGKKGCPTRKKGGH